MDNQFFFDPGRYDFWPLYETIKKYYPVGIVWNEENGQRSFYEAYPGLKEKARLMEDNIHVPKNYRQRWGKFLKLLKKQIKQPVDDTGGGLHPCFSGSVLLEKRENNNFIITKELHFMVSLLGPYYTMYGLDQSTLGLESVAPPFSRWEEQRKFVSDYPATHAVTVSPLLEYETIFRLVQENIKTSFPAYRFVPYQICSQQLQGLYTDVEDGRGYIYQALFNDYLPFEVRARGDTQYGYKEWLKDEGPAARENQLRLAYALQESIRSVHNHQPDVSLHRVWQLSRVNRMPSMPNSSKGRIGFMHVPPVTLLDLTDPATAIMKTADDDKETLNATSYRVVDQEILIEYWRRPPVIEMKFKISSLSVDQLRLILYINANKDGLTLQGDLAEYVYERVSHPE
jgi:hypothetical protein